jgi:hypothetical protein
LSLEAIDRCSDGEHRVEPSRSKKEEVVGSEACGVAPSADEDISRSIGHLDQLADVRFPLRLNDRVQIEDDEMIRAPSVLPRRIRAGSAAAADEGQQKKKTRGMHHPVSGVIFVVFLSPPELPQSIFPEGEREVTIAL